MKETATVALRWKLQKKSAYSRNLNIFVVR